VRLVGGDDAVQQVEALRGSRLPERLERLPGGGDGLVDVGGGPERDDGDVVLVGGVRDRKSFGVVARPTSVDVNWRNPSWVSPG
jgi:hypothetical protein